MSTNSFKIIVKLYSALFLFILFSSCTSLKAPSKEIVIDHVCGMHVNKAEAYDWKYKGVKYYFDSYVCKESFKMNPEKFIENKCVENK